MPASGQQKNRVLHTNSDHFSTNAAAAMGVLMLLLAEAVNSAVSAFI